MKKTKLLLLALVAAQMVGASYAMIHHMPNRQQVKSHSSVITSHPTASTKAAGLANNPKVMAGAAGAESALANKNQNQPQSPSTPNGVPFSNIPSGMAADAESAAGDLPAGAGRTIAGDLSAGAESAVGNAVQGEIARKMTNPIIP